MRCSYSLRLIVLVGHRFLNDSCKCGLILTRIQSPVLQDNPLNEPALSLCGFSWSPTSRPSLNTHRTLELLILYMLARDRIRVYFFTISSCSWMSYYFQPMSKNVAILLEISTFNCFSRCCEDFKFNL